MGRQFVGMDVGASGVKLAFFRGVGAKAEFGGFAEMDTEGEGILGEGELYAAVRELLASRRQQGAGVFLGVPQYQVTTKVADYPEKVGRLELSRLVALEARQLTGVTDEALVHGYTPLPAGLGRRRPVLIALSREDAIRERLGQLESGGLSCLSLVPSGLALAAACLELAPGLSSCREPVLLLDIGMESTTMAVLAAGQVLYLCTLMFGAVRFDEAARQYQQAHRSVEGQAGRLEYLSQVDLCSETRQSPLQQAAQTLESEIQNAVEHWRSMESEALAATPVPLMYVTGGGSRLGGLCEWLSQVLECRVEQLGPTENGQVRPELTVAYGLGLQACGRSPLSLSLVPGEVEELRLRRRRWPFLAVSAGLLVSVVIGSLLGSMLESRQANAALEIRRKDLTASVDEGASILRLRRAADDEERCLVEMAVPGNGARRLADAMSQLSSAPLPQGWLVCLADAASVAAPQDFLGGERPSAGSGLLGGGGSGKGEDARPRNVAASYVCAGFVPRESAQESIAGLLRHLDGMGAFRGVDRADSIEKGSLSQWVWRWRECLNGVPELRRTGGANGYELFTLSLPFARPDVRAEEKE